MSFDSVTREPPRRPAGADPPPVTAATLLSHPNLRRVGDRALLPELDAGAEVLLSRGSPDFAPPESAWGRPLDDPYLSRRPVSLSRGPAGGLEIRQGESPSTLRVDGREIAGRVLVDGAALDGGVTLELADRVAMVLHRLPARLAGQGAAFGLGMVGASAGAARVRASVERVADLEVPVLLRGESGTGKELTAQAVHDRGPRRDGPFVAVNLGAIPPALAAAELFGSVKGAFTGAVGGQRGYFLTAHGGTLFLDEVGEAPAEVQVMLLRALETGEIYPLGSQQPRRVDVRLVAATDSDLEARVRRGDFKAPLLHRLAAYEITLPPLRERRDDIGRLLVHFARQELGALGQLSALEDHDPDAPPWLPADLAARLARFGWPGNVRQLRNVLRQLVIDARGRGSLEVGHRIESLLATPDPVSAPAPAGPRRPADIDDGELEGALADAGYDVASAARALGISRPSVYNLIRRHPQLRTAEDVPGDELEDTLDRYGDDVEGAAAALRVSARALNRRLGRRGGRRP
ncbi:MAG: sigma 54-interacting transcriptional regulator [Acidobacteriota bacterium]